MTHHLTAPLAAARVADLHRHANRQRERAALPAPIASARHRARLGRAATVLRLGARRADRPRTA